MFATPGSFRLVTVLIAANAACASAPKVAETPSPSSPPMSVSVEIANQSRERIDLYLVTETQERLIGRIEPLTRVRLPLPSGVEPAAASMIRLAVIAGGAYVLSPSRDARAVLSIKQPLAALATQEWLYTSGQLIPLDRSARPWLDGAGRRRDRHGVTAAAVAALGPAGKCSFTYFMSKL